MRRIIGKVCMALFVPVLLASLLLAGCGSADSGDYEHEVAEINRVTSQKLEESLHLLGEEEEGQVDEEAHAEAETEGEAQAEEEEEAHVEGEAEEEGQVELVVKALEEVVIVLEEALLELEGVKVPAGMEDYHRQLTSFYRANLSAYEAYLAALAPAEEDAEGEAHAEEEGAESHEEETAGDGETPQQEEAPAESGGH